MQGHQYIFDTTGRYLKLMSAIHLSKTTSTYIANLFFEQWIAPSGIPSYLYTDVCVQFKSKLFASKCSMLGVKYLTTMIYHPQTNCKAEHYIKMILTYLQHYVSEQRKDWVTVVQPLTYAHNTQMYSSANQTPYSLVLSRHQPGPAPLRRDRAVPTDAYDDTYPLLLCPSLKARICARRDKFNVHSQVLQQRYEYDYDQRVRKTLAFNPLDFVFVDRPLFTAIKNAEALPLASDEYSKSMPRSLCSFCFISVPAHIVAIS